MRWPFLLASASGALFLNHYYTIYYQFRTPAA